MPLNEKYGTFKNCPGIIIFTTSMNNYGRIGAEKFFGPRAPPPQKKSKAKNMIPVFHFKKYALSRGAGRFGGTQLFWGFKALWECFWALIF